MNHSVQTPPTCNALPPIATAHFRLPAQEDYDTFMNELFKAKLHAGEGGGDLEVAAIALFAAVDLITSDRIGNDCELDRPLRRLAIVVATIIQGGKPDLIYKRPAAARGRPSSMPGDAVYGALAALLDLLMETGLQREEAAKLVATKANASGILGLVRKTRRQPIKPAQVQRWRDEIGGRANPMMHKAYDRGCQYYKEALQSCGGDRKKLAACVSSMTDHLAKRI